MTADRIQACIYTRISTAVLNDTTSTDDQERQCRELCTRRGWDVAAVFTDHSRSAWHRDRKRPGWDAMLKGTRAGQFGAIVTYWGDRIVRQPRDLEDLLDLREVRRITLASISGQYDFDNPDHRMMMRWEVARACNESDTISRRTHNAHERRRRAGVVRGGGRGGRAYGFTTDGVTQVPAEAELIREASRRILAGEGTGAICRDWRERGILTVTGIPFEHWPLRKLLERPRLAGLMPDGISKAAWEPVLEPAQWEMTRAVLAARGAGFGYATNARHHLLSGIATCGACETPLQVNPSKGRGGAYVTGYACRAPGCKKVYRSQPLLDDYVTGAVVTRLGLAANPAPGQPPRDHGEGELGALIARRAETAEAITNLADHPGLDIGMLARSLASFDAKITELTGRLAASTGAALLQAHAGVSAEEFAVLPLSTRRALVRLTWVIIVMPASKRGPGFEPRDVIMAPVRPGG